MGPVIVVVFRVVGRLVEGCRGRFVPDRQRFLLPSRPSPVGGMYQGHPPIYMMYYVFRITVTTGVVGVCVVAGCVSWLCVCQEWYVLYGVSVLRGYVL